MGPLSAEYHYRATVTEDGRPATEPIRFQFHLSTGILAKRMSGLELMPFIVTHMMAARGIVAAIHDPGGRILADWDTILRRILSWPHDALDECLGWLKPILRVEEDDLIVLSLDTHPLDVLAGPMYFLPSLVFA